jgi:hypothetical protein
MWGSLQGGRQRKKGGHGLEGTIKLGECSKPLHLARSGSGLINASAHAGAVPMEPVAVQLKAALDAARRSISLPTLTDQEVTPRKTKKR